MCLSRPVTDFKTVLPFKLMPWSSKEMCTGQTLLTVKVYSLLEYQQSVLGFVVLAVHV